MKFKKVEDNQYFYHRISSGTIDIGVYPTMFGWRVRAGYVGSLWIELDWCCGDKPGLVWGTYEMLRELLESGVKMEDLPGRNVSTPWTCDPEFMKRVFSKGAKLNISPGDIPDFETIRAKHLSTHTLLQR